MSDKDFRKAMASLRLQAPCPSAATTLAIAPYWSNLPLIQPAWSHSSAANRKRTQCQIVPCASVAVRGYRKHDQRTHGSSGRSSSAKFRLDMKMQIANHECSYQRGQPGLHDRNKQPNRDISWTQYVMVGNAYGWVNWPYTICR
jgi:hypothetical protein